MQGVDKPQPQSSLDEGGESLTKGRGLDEGQGLGRTLSRVHALVNLCAVYPCYGGLQGDDTSEGFLALMSETTRLDSSGL